jgi:hypothetical protein
MYINYYIASSSSQESQCHYNGAASGRLPFNDDPVEQSAGNCSNAQGMAMTALKNGIAAQEKEAVVGYFHSNKDSIDTQLSQHAR